MKYIFLYIAFSICMEVSGQSKIPYPKPVVIDLSQPEASMPKNLDKEAKKKWKALKRQKRLDAKLTDQLFSNKLDSLKSSIVADYLPDSFEPVSIDSLKNFDIKKSLKDSLFNTSTLYKQSEIQRLKKKYGMPDSLVGLSMNDLPSGIKYDSLSAKDQFKWSLDSSLINSPNYEKYIDEVSALNDSLSSVDYSVLASSLTSQNIEQQVLTSDYFNSLSLSSNSQDPENMMASYEEMINSDQYKNLMQDMPGKQEEIEKAIQTKDIKLDSLPVKPNFFLGQEDKLAAAQRQLEVIKKKRSFKDILRSFVNQDMESLEEKSFTQKFSLSGHIQIGGRQPLLIDYSPAIAYQFTGKSSIGIGASGRLKIGNEPSEQKDLVAYRGFFDYKLIGNIFLHTEWENTGLKEFDPVTDIEARIWTSRWLLGLGKDFNFGRNVKGNILILYNFNSNSDTPHGQRIQVRYGFKF